MVVLDNAEREAGDNDDDDGGNNDAGEQKLKKHTQMRVQMQY